MKRPRLTVKRIISIGSVLSLGGVSLAFNVNQDFRTMVTQTVVTVKEGAVKLVPVMRAVHDTVPGPAPPPDTVAVPVIDIVLVDVVQAALEDIQTEFGLVAQQVDSLSAGIAALTLRHETMAARLQDLAARESRPVVYLVVDSVLTPVDPDTIQGAEGWLRILWPWLKER